MGRLFRPKPSEAVIKCHMCVILTAPDAYVDGIAHGIGPEHSRLRPSSGMFLASCPEKRGDSPDQPIAAEHPFRESPRMAPGDSFATPGPFTDLHGPNDDFRGG